MSKLLDLLKINAPKVYSSVMARKVYKDHPKVEKDDFIQGLEKDQLKVDSMDVGNPTESVLK